MRVRDGICEINDRGIGRTTWMLNHAMSLLERGFSVCILTASNKMSDHLANLIVEKRPYYSRTNEMRIERRMGGCIDFVSKPSLSRNRGMIYDVILEDNQYTDEKIRDLESRIGDLEDLLKEKME